MNSVHNFPCFLAINCRVGCGGRFFSFLNFQPYRFISTLTVFVAFLVSFLLSVHFNKLLLFLGKWQGKVRWFFIKYFPKRILS